MTGNQMQSSKITAPGIDPSEENLIADAMNNKFLSVAVDIPRASACTYMYMLRLLKHFALSPKDLLTIYSIGVT